MFQAPFHHFIGTPHLVLRIETELFYNVKPYTFRIRKERGFAMSVSAHDADLFVTESGDIIQHQIDRARQIAADEIRVFDDVAVDTGNIQTLPPQPLDQSVVVDRPEQNQSVQFFFA